MNLIANFYLQIALDIISLSDLEKILINIPKDDRILLEAGTPLIKKFGISVLEKIREHHPESYIIADMKTLDVGWLEVLIAAEAKGNAVAISGLASIDTIESSLKEGKKQDIDIILDCMNVNHPKQLLSSLSRIPEIILFHRGIDQENNMDHPWDLIQDLKSTYPDSLIAVAGGLNIDTSQRALKNGADIIVVGRAITQAEDIVKTTQSFLALLN
jgi:bifunctional enzyme Fae/Hps